MKRLSFMEQDQTERECLYSSSSGRSLREMPLKQKEGYSLLNAPIV